MTVELEILRPDDWHLHLRDGAILAAVAPHSTWARRAIIMPNLDPPVTTSAEAAAYQHRIRRALPRGSDFTPLMTLYLTERTDPADLAAGVETGIVTAAKLYPAGATTNSARGVRDLDAIMPVLERMAELGVPLCTHGEVTAPEVDIFDREAVFIERVLAPLRQRLPELKVVMEHVTTAEGVDYVRESAPGIGATITVQHLMLNRNALFAGGIRPHYYCLPVLKRERHRQALRRAATSGHARFFLGTDSAPHLKGAKEAPCGCAGCFTAPVALPCLAHVFEEEGALDRLEAFASRNGPAFYGLAPNRDRLRLQKTRSPMRPPSSIQTPEGPVEVFDPGVALYWQMEPAYA
ncbi:dihydroorotase [Roseivivax sp.]